MTTIEGYLKDLWEKAIDYIKQIENSGIDNLILDTYYAPAKLVSIDNGKATIVVGSEITKQVIKDKTNLIELALNYLLNETISCYVITEIEYKNHSINQPSFHHSSQTEESFFQLKLKPDFTFENFVVGQSNNEARSAALACAYNPGKFYTPLFIYGNSGLGKTHLLHAIGNYVSKHYPDKKI